jgi:hypothetical protein
MSAAGGRQQRTWRLSTAELNLVLFLPLKNATWITLCGCKGFLFYGAGGALTKILSVKYIPLSILLLYLDL